MPYNKFDIKLEDEKSNEALQAVLFQYQNAIEELIDEVKNIKSDYKSSAMEILSLGLTQDEVSEIRQYFVTNRKKNREEHKNWISNWMKNNVYDMPEKYMYKLIEVFEIPEEDMDFYDNFCDKFIPVLEQFVKDNPIE